MALPAAALVALLSALVAPAASQDVAVRAPAQLTEDDCNCQCISLSFQSGGRDFGNCQATFNNAVWCYVRGGANSPCFDATQSTRFTGAYWSFHACTTPPRRRCLRQIGRRGGNGGGGGRRNNGVGTRTSPGGTSDDNSVTFGDDKVTISGSGVSFPQASGSGSDTENP